MPLRPYRVGRARTGLGLFATAPIAKGTLVIEYTGPRIPTPEARRKERARGARYMFEIDGEWTIDGSPRSNLARYINHACRPNVEAELLRGRMMLRAVRSIRADEEITIHYGREYLELFMPDCKCAHCGRPRKSKRSPGNNGKSRKA